MTALGALRSAHFEIRMRIATSPRSRMLYRPVVWWAQYKVRRTGEDEPRERDVLPDTQLVIDGFQGSANTYLTRAFQYAQPRPVRLAHHLHAAAGVLQGVRLGLPVLVTIREPAGAALSLVARWPYVSLAQALRQYVRYYEALEPVVDALILSPFAASTRRPDLVIEAVNRRFGTAFTPLPMTEADLQAVRPMTPKRVANMAARAEAREKRSLEWGTPATARWRALAEAVYLRMIAHVPPELLAVEAR